MSVLSSNKEYQAFPKTNRPQLWEQMASTLTRSSVHVRSRTTSSTPERFGGESRLRRRFPETKIAVPEVAKPRLSSRMSSSSRSDKRAHITAGKYFTPMKCSHTMAKNMANVSYISVLLLCLAISCTFFADFLEFLGQQLETKIQGRVVLQGRKLNETDSAGPDISQTRFRFSSNFNKIKPTRRSNSNAF
ncbi:Hypothetical_protein [Hexamita inflata]|uniref:Hypothetical_protein n=1 Tax=Hexamita inflata TaxID=28002 RepID=A0AA86QWP3_9EUKA|nr:Hypothetical protein HINF_LOCUS53203 [Hexamita inflata]